MKRIWRWLAVTAALCLLCTGCSLDVESYLQPPRAQGEQLQVQQALETYIRDRHSSERYTLRYPTEGEYLSAFVLCDSQGYPVEDDSAEAQMAVAFYTLAEETHINLLRRDGEDWLSVADDVGRGTDIRQVAFGDLDGNGTVELLTGWSTYNSRDHRLAIYSTQNGLALLTDERLYTNLYVGDVTATGGDSLLLLRIGSGNQVTASLEQLLPGVLQTVATVSLDGQIQHFGNMTLCRLAQGVHGLYVEGVRQDNTLVTELIYYDSTGLHAPFYDAVSNTTEVTRRSNGLFARDIDGDGRVEIPQSHLLSDRTDAAGLTDYLTRWCAWDYTTRTWSDRMQTVVNTADSYMVVLDEVVREDLTTVYDPNTHTLDLLHGEAGLVWLRVCAGTGGSAPREEMKKVTLFEDDENIRCTAWFDPLTVEAEKVHYMVLRLTEGG